MAAIPNRAVFRSQEVCEIAEVQPYVLRSWEAEFPDLGLSKSAGAPRIYRRGDLERVLRLKHLLFVDGLTLAGARRQMSEEEPAAGTMPVDDEETVPDKDVAALLDREVRNNLRNVKSGLQWILGVLAGRGASNGGIRMSPARGRSAAKRRTTGGGSRKATSRKAVRLNRSRPAKAAKPARSSKRAASRRKR